MPTKETIKYLEKDPPKVIGDLFDIVLNGTEIGSGSIRINKPELQEKVMKVIDIFKKVKTAFIYPTNLALSISYTELSDE